MRPLFIVAVIVLSLPRVAAAALPPPCNSGTVFEDRNGNGRQDGGEPGLAGIKLSDGVELVTTDARGRYRLPVVDGRSSFLIKPAGYRVPMRANGLPDYWRNVQASAGPVVKYGGIPAAPAACRHHALTKSAQASRRGTGMEVLLFADPQPKSTTDVGYYSRDIVQSVLHDRAASGAAALGISGWMTSAWMTSA